MKPGEMERTISHLSHVAKQAQERLSGIAREVAALRGNLEGPGPGVNPAADAPDASEEIFR